MLCDGKVGRLILSSNDCMGFRLDGVLPHAYRYFHPPSEIIIGAVVGLVLFQAPLLLFVVRLLQAHETKDKKVEEHKHN